MDTAVGSVSCSVHFSITEGLQRTVMPPDSFSLYPIFSCSSMLASKLWGVVKVRVAHTESMVRICFDPFVKGTGKLNVTVAVLAEALPPDAPKNVPSSQIEYPNATPPLSWR